MTKSQSKIEKANEKSVAELPYVRMIIPEAEGGFRGEILELRGCYAEGGSEIETLQALEFAASSWIEAASESGKLLPQPMDLSNEFSGKLMLRISKGMHKRAAMFAELDGVSLNQFISNCLAHALGEKVSPTKNTMFVSINSFSPRFENYFTSQNETGFFQNENDGDTLTNENRAFTVPSLPPRAFKEIIWPNFETINDAENKQTA